MSERSLIKFSLLFSGSMLAALVAFFWSIPESRAQGEDGPTTTISKNSYKNFISTNNWSGSYNLGLSTFEKDSVNSKTNIVSLLLNTDLHLRFSNNFALLLMPGVSLETGSTQSLAASDKPENKLILRKAVAEFKALEAIQLEVGALREAEMHSSLLIDDRAFPGAKLSLHTPGAYQFGVLAEQSVPTSTTLASQTNSIEAQPSFSAAGLGARIQLSTLLLELKALQFQFNNLPSSVAQESGYAGNDVIPVSQTTTYFAYQFKGTEVTSRLKLNLHKNWLVNLGGDYLKNNEAPELLNQGHQLYAESKHRFGNLVVAPRITQFYLEPDASPAYYSSSQFGNNRQGYSYGLSLEFRSLNLRSSLQYTDSKLIYFSPQLADEKQFFISLGTLDAFF